MSDKLKTLKSLPSYINGTTVDIRLLRQAAREWVEEISKHNRNCAGCGMLACDDDEGKVRRWIWAFFNLNEEEE